MEKVAGVVLAKVWSGIDLEMKSRETKVIGGFVLQRFNSRKSNDPLLQLEISTSVKMSILQTLQFV